MFSYFSIAVIKHHDQGNLYKQGFRFLFLTGAVVESSRIDPKHKAKRSNWEMVGVFYFYFIIFFCNILRVHFNF